MHIHKENYMMHLNSISHSPSLQYRCNHKNPTVTKERLYWKKVSDDEHEDELNHECSKHIF
jgi:hypothetical protein